MKTKNFKRTGPLKSYTDKSGISPYARLEKFASPASDESHARNTESYIARRDNDRATRKADRERRKLERDLDWDLVKVLLDGKLGLSLADAKSIAEGLQPLYETNI